MAWILANGAEVPDGLNVLHKCDNRPCCNPVHLVLGTQQDNIDDMYAKGRNRNPRGESCGKSVLTEKLVREIRDYRHKTGLGYKTIARHFGVGLGAVRFVVNRVTWRHVD